MAADTAFFMGLIDTPQRLQALKLQFALSQLITAGASDTRNLYPEH